MSFANQYGNLQSVFLTSRKAAIHGSDINVLPKVADSIQKSAEAIQKRAKSPAHLSRRLAR